MHSKAFLKWNCAKLSEKLIKTYAKSIKNSVFSWMTLINGPVLKERWSKVTNVSNEKTSNVIQLQHALQTLSSVNN